MSFNQKNQTIRFERGGGDRLLPKGFLNTLTRKFLPALSLTYISLVLGIAGRRDDFMDYLFHKKEPYAMALLVAGWVALPAVLWIFLKGVPMFERYANDWYKIVATLMVVTLGLSYMLFPEADIWGLRIFFVASIPMFFFIYWLFIKDGLPALAAHPLTALGLTFLIYGAAIRFIY